MGEDARQYQIALEHARKARSELTGVLSLASEVQAAETDAEHYRRGMTGAVLNHQYQRS